MAEKSPEVKAPEPEILYKVAIFQFNRAADSVSVWHDEIHPASAFADELEYLIEIGAIVPAPPAAQ